MDKDKTLLSLLQEKINFFLFSVYLQGIKLENFKNHLQWEGVFEQNWVRFLGPNAVGKTNLLDAIHYLCLTKSYFSSYQDRMQIYQNHDYFSITGRFLQDQQAEDLSFDEEIRIFCEYRAEKTQKKVTKNGKKYENLQAHIGRFPVVVISPEDSHLIEGSSEERRRFLDRTLSQYDSEYLKNLQNYHKILDERNIFLKQWEFLSVVDRNYLDVLDAKMSHYGEKIFKAREEFIKEFLPFFHQYHQKITAGQQEQGKIDFLSAQKIEKLSFLLEKNRSLDLQKQHSTQGIHREDLSFEFNDHPLKNRASQGQKKSFLLALKLAQSAFLTHKNAINPILLLDDLFDHLDKKRLEALLEILPSNPNQQIFMTHTDQLPDVYFDQKNVQDFYLKK